jgi:hypothetical protein
VEEWMAQVSILRREKGPRESGLLEIFWASASGLKNNEPNKNRMNSLLKFIIIFFTFCVFQRALSEFS